MRTPRDASGRRNDDDGGVFRYAAARFPGTDLRALPAQLVRFAWIQIQCCAFAGLIFVGLAATTVLWARFDMPIARYDALLVDVIVIQIAFVALRIETVRELGVICCFHLLGLTLEIFKVHVGSWSYPDAGVVRLAGVPIFSGFMYASVGSYICQAFRRFDLRITGFRWVPVSILAVTAYLNFFTHHVIWDLRWLIAAGFVAATWRTNVRFTVGLRRYQMPLALSFCCMGFFLWVAENLATLLGAWRYPDQRHAWHMVHVSKFGSWALLVSLSFFLVATVKSREGTIYGSRHPAVTG